MVCEKCGQINSDDEKLCKICGTVLESKPQHSKSPQSKLKISTGKSKSQEIWTPSASDGNEQTLSMKWYRFLTKFGLIATAVLCIAAGGLYYYPIFANIWNTVYTIIHVILGIFAFIVRNALAKQKKRAPLMFFSLYSTITLFSPSYILAKQGVLRFGRSIPMIHIGHLFIWPFLYILLTIIPVLLLICNMVYFGKRRNMFIY
ncbi:MAG: hypothetical protein IKM46_07790 [Clostridia bacterium]|nr:hypothetical protein [Clostridia bacterium]